MKSKNLPEKLTLVYLALPWLIFSWGWLRIEGAILMTFVLLTGVVGVWTQINRDKKNEDGDEIPFLWWTAGALALGWLTLSWVGGYGGINISWSKGQTLLTELTSRSWPVGYFSKASGGADPLVTELAYYLPAAFIGKWLGWPLSQLTLFIWSFLGVVLSFVWLFRIVRGVPLKVGLIFIVLGGLHWIGDIVYSNHILEGTHVAEGWSNLWSYLSNTGLIFSVPSHAVAGWVATGSILYSLLHKKSITTAVFLWVLTGLWSLPVMAGLLPFLLVGVFINRKNNGMWNIFTLLPAAGLFSITALYYLSRKPLVTLQWLGMQEDIYILWPKLLSFYMVEFGVFVVFCRRKLLDLGDKNKIWWWMAIGILLAGPWGVGRDTESLTSLVTIPAFFVFWTFVIKNFLDQERDLSFKFFTLAILIGSFSAVSHISRSLSYSKLEIPEIMESRSINEMTTWPPPEFLGYQKSFFFSRMAKKMKDLNSTGVFYKNLAPSSVLAIEAEQYENKTRIDFHQEYRLASNKMIVDNGFGEVKGDRLEYSFSLSAPLNKTRFSLIYATEWDGVILDLEVDGALVGSVSCPSTNEWWEFHQAGLDSYSLKPGAHKLVVISNGVNVNLDSILISERNSTQINLEAEKNISTTRFNHVQGIAHARGGKIIDNGFGGSPKDILTYNFHWDTPRRGALVLSYATERTGASYDIFIDGKRKGSVHFIRTSDWSDFQLASFSLGSLSSGNHQISLQSNGVNVNFDTLYIRGG